MGVVVFDSIYIGREESQFDSDLVWLSIYLIAALILRHPLANAFAFMFVAFSLNLFSSVCFVK